MNRREMLRLSTAGLAGSKSLFAANRSQSDPQAPATHAPGDSTGTTPLPLEQFLPKSTLHASITQVPRSRYPVIDFHTHLTMTDGMSRTPRIRFSAQPEECLQVMDRRNIRTLVNLTSGYGDSLRQAIAAFQTAHPGRFICFTEPAYGLADNQNYPQKQADLIQDAHQSGAKGLKVLKTLGLYLREQITTGPLVRIDDRRFDPMWDAVGSFNMPVAIHTSDPEAFFLPIDRFNERWEELHAHPSWSFYGKDFPSNRELQEARRNVMRRHPKTTFVCLHVADAEDLPYVSECLDTHPNMYVEIAARVNELGRQPRAAKRFIEKYQDRVMFGTDAIPKGYDVPQQIFGDELYEIYYRFLESEDEYFDYAPAPKPPQGRWRISGLGLSDDVLHKVYWSNAARLLGLS
jgi:predicted TIM-barrel fold metal-dependent hydrolase